MPTLIISSGQTSTVSSGVIDINDVVLAGGTEIVASGGFTSIMTIQFGGFEQVMAGGTAAGTVISGGTLEIQPVQRHRRQTGDRRHHRPTSTISGFVTGDTIDGTTMPTSTISGFVTGDTIDFIGVSFANGGSIQLGTGNVLNLLEGGSSYSLQLDPGQNFAGKSFRLSSDGAGGTDIQVVNGATINIVAGYGVVQSGAFSITIGTSLGRSQQTYVDSSFSYTSVRQELINEGAAGASTLPATNPSTRVLGLGPAEEKALGLITSTSFSFDYDGYVVFNDSAGMMSYAPNVAPSPFSSYYFVGVVEHEISEVLGRTSWLNFGNYLSVMDLFRYASSGVRQLTSGGGSPSYFSIDSGATSLDRWNSNPASGDLGDWDTSAGDDALNNASFSSVINSLTTTDVINMSALGFVTAVSVSSGQTVSITSGQTSSG